MKPRRFFIGMAAAVAIAATAAGTFLVVQSLDDEGDATAAPPGTATLATGDTPVIPTPPGPDVTPAPGATPDTSQPWWYVPWVNAERDKPLFEGTLAGIYIANGASGPAYKCEGTGTLSEDVSEADGTAVDVRLDAVPESLITEQMSLTTSLCDGMPYAAEVHYLIDADEEWAPFGGSVMLYRHHGEPIASVAIPAWRWEEREIASLRVAVAHPILDDLGLGQSAVVAYREGVVTVILANEIPFHRLLNIGEEVLR
jgi:hypothetical protein